VEAENATSVDLPIQGGGAMDIIAILTVYSDSIGYILIFVCPDSLFTIIAKSLKNDQVMKLRFDE
jgi:hypothetical protein